MDKSNDIKFLQSENRLFIDSTVEVFRKEKSLKSIILSSENIPSIFFKEEVFKFPKSGKVDLKPLNIFFIEITEDVLKKDIFN